MDATQTNFLTMALSREDHEIARKFSVQQDTVEKGKQVYLNTLAILGVRSFLDWLGIETDLNAGDSWHSVIRCFQNVADLVIPNLGKLECRPVLPGETVISLPPEVTEDRIAYVGVKFQEQLNEVQLLGFYPAIDPQSPPQEIKIINLQPIESLIDYLDYLEESLDRQGIASVSLEGQYDGSINILLVSLTEWFQDIRNIFRTGWEILENFLNDTQDVDLAFRFATAPRSRNTTDNADHKAASISAIKPIQVAGYPLALVVSLQRETEPTVDILFRLYPTGNQTYIPGHLKLIVLDEEGETFLEAESRSIDNWIQINFRGQPGERFRIVVTLDNDSVTEDFEI